MLKNNKEKNDDVRKKVYANDAIAASMVIGKIIEGTPLEGDVFLYGDCALHLSYNGGFREITMMAITEVRMDILFNFLEIKGLKVFGKPKFNKNDEVVFKIEGIDTPIRIRPFSDGSAFMKDDKAKAAYAKGGIILLLYSDSVTRTFNTDCFYVCISDIAKEGAVSINMYDPMEILRSESGTLVDATLNVDFATEYSIIDVTANTSLVMEAICVVSECDCDMSERLDAALMKITKLKGVSFGGKQNMRMWFMRMMECDYTDYIIFSLNRYKILPSLIPEFEGIDVLFNTDTLSYKIGEDEEMDKFGDAMASISRCGRDTVMKTAILFGKMAHLKSLSKKGISPEKNAIRMAKSYLERIGVDDEFKENVIDILEDRVVWDGIFSEKDYDVSYGKAESVRNISMKRYSRMLKYATLSRNDCGKKLANDIIEMSINNIMNSEPIIYKEEEIKKINKENDDLL